MSAAYKCDRCGDYTDGGRIVRVLRSVADVPMQGGEFMASDIDMQLCEQCSTDFRHWKTHVLRQGK